MSSTHTEYAKGKNANEINIVFEQMNGGSWKNNLSKARKLVESKAVQKDPGELNLWLVQSEDGARNYTVYLGEDDSGCSCADAKNRGRYCKHYVAAEFQKRLNQRNGSATKMEKTAPKQQSQNTRHDPVKQAEEEAARECQEAYESIDAKYHRFITLIQQNKKVGGTRQNPIYASIKKPYMQVDGRVAMALGEGRLSNYTELIEIGDNVIVKATVVTERGTSTGIADVKFGGTGVDATNPIENAETSAVGRALGFLGYGIFGCGIASAEEVQNAIEQQAQPEYTKASAKDSRENTDDPERETLISEIREHIRPMSTELRNNFFQDFFHCKPAEIAMMETESIRECWQSACEELAIG